MPRIGHTPPLRWSIPRLTGWFPRWVCRFPASTPTSPLPIRHHPTPNDRERPPVQRSLTTGNGGAHHAPRNVQYQSGAPVTQPRPTGGIKGYYALVNGGAPPPQRAGTSHPTAGLSGYASTQISLAQTYNGRGNLAPRNEPEHSPGGLCVTRGEVATRYKNGDGCCRGNQAQECDTTRRHDREGRRLWGRVFDSR